MAILCMRCGIKDKTMHYQSAYCQGEECERCGESAGGEYRKYDKEKDD